MGLVLGQDRLQVPPAEDQHPVGDLGPGREHEPLRIGIRARAPWRDLHGLDTGVGRGTSSSAFLEADDRPSKTSQPQTRTKMG
jgi:hypothetical protein